MFESLKTAATIFFLIIWGALSNIAAAAQSETRDYLPLGRAELGRPFPLKRVASLDSTQNFTRRLDIGVATAELKLDEERGLVLTGKDRAGNPWRVAATGGSPGGVKIYVADLDRNGLRDLLLHAPTGGNGLAPSSHIVVVTFERETGRPVRFEAEGYFEAGAADIFELRDMNGDGRAELIHMNFGGGYWITNIYTASNARWRRIKGRFGTRRSFPLHTRFTNRPNRRATTPPANRKPFAPDLSNDAPKLRGRLVSYRWANISQSEDIELNFETTAGQQVTCRPASWYSSFTIVKDGARGREIFSFGGGEDDIKRVLDEIIAGRYEVSLSGRRKAEGCQPELLWVQMK